MSRWTVFVGFALVVLLLGSSQPAQAIPHKGEFATDRSITLTPVFDAFVQVGTTGSDTSRDRELRLGTFDGTTVARSFLNWDTRRISGAAVERAVLRLHAFHSWSCQPREWEVWSTDLATTSSRWTGQPRWRKKWATTKRTTGYSESCPDGPVEVDITELVRDWVEQGQAEVGVGLRASDEADEFGWKKFESAESENPPVIKIDLK